MSTKLASSFIVSNVLFITENIDRVFQPNKIYTYKFSAPINYKLLFSTLADIFTKVKLLKRKTVACSFSPVDF